MPNDIDTIMATAPDAEEQGYQQGFSDGRDSMADEMHPESALDAAYQQGWKEACEEMAGTGKAFAREQHRWCCEATAHHIAGLIEDQAVNPESLKTDDLRRHVARMKDQLRDAEGLLIERTRRELIEGGGK